jgi:hypothetical protein
MSDLSPQSGPKQTLVIQIVDRDLLWPRAPIYIEPPPPQVVIHLHLIVAVKEHPLA